MKIDNLTVLTCNFNTPKEVDYMLRSLRVTARRVPKVLVINTSTEPESDSLLNDLKVPYINLSGYTHGEAVNEAFNYIDTEYVLLVDSDIIFLQDFEKPFDAFKTSGAAIMGKVVTNCGYKALHPRVEPWYCFLNLKKLKEFNIKFFDPIRTKKSKEDGERIYDIGSTMFEDIEASNMLIADASMENKYFKHYGGMSWRVQSYNPDQEDTDIDFGGTHPNKILYDYGLVVKETYDKETVIFDDVNVVGYF